MRPHTSNAARQLPVLMHRYALQRWRARGALGCAFGAIALATGRTSMPAIFVAGKSIGGFTDGDPVGDPDLCHFGASGLEALGDRELRELLS